MRKVIALFCSITMLFCVVSCGNDADKLVTSPSEDYVIKSLEKVPGILEIEAVTEDTDPMNNLNKPHWYIANIYFSYELVDQEDVYGDCLVDKGTDAGGSIEVYMTKSDAQKRDEYLSSFDGGVLSPGSHAVIGTVVVRTSDELTASQQKLLESNIIAALQGKDDKIVAHKTDYEDNDDDSFPRPSGHTKEDAVNDVEKHAGEFETEYPSDYLTPNYTTAYLRDVLGYSETIATYATENCNIDWEAHAKKYAQIYLTYEEEFGMHASWHTPSDIEDVLLGEGFFSDIVEVIMSAIDWTDQAKKYVKHLSDFYDTFNRFEAKRYLENVANSEEEVDYLLENSGVDWKQHALNMANKLWLEYNSQPYYQYESTNFILADIQEELYYLWGYTQSETIYAIQNVSV